MRIINTKFLEPGMKTGKQVYSSDGTILLQSGIILTENYIKNLTDKNIPALYIDDELSEGIEINDAVDLEIKAQAVETIKNIFDGLSQIKNVKAKNNFITDEAYFDIRYAINRIMDNLKQNKSGLFNMAEVMSTDLSAYTHSVNVAILSMLVGRSLWLDDKQLVNLGTGALMHDIGRARIPAEIMNKPSALTKEEEKIIQQHPLIGYEMVKSNMTISAMVKTIILMHHERLNGTGYPNGLRAEKINNFVRIVSICDIFEAITSDRAYRKKMPIYQALELLNVQAVNTIDPKICIELRKSIAIYPLGTAVILSNGKKGLIIENRKSHSMRPKVKLTHNEDGSRVSGFKVIDLMKELTLFIEDVCEITR